MFKGALRDLLSNEAVLKDGEHVLEEEIPKAWKMADEAVGDLKDKEIDEALSRGSANWPGWGRILRGFNPVSAINEGFKDIGELKWSDWRSLASKSAWKDVRPFIGDPEIHEAVQSLSKDLESVEKVPAVHAFLANVDGNRAFWRFVTAPAVAADYFNHFITMTRIRDRFLDDIGLGWAK
jgi:hypothetical protein